MRDREKTRISTVAAQALYEKMRHYDRELRERVRAVTAATAAIAAAHSSAQEIYAKRAEIAKELDNLAPEDFLAAGGAEAAAKSFRGRWYEPNPLPPYNPATNFEAPYTGKSGAPKRPEDDLDHEI